MHALDFELAENFSIALAVILKLACADHSW